MITKAKVSEFNEGLHTTDDRYEIELICKGGRVTLDFSADVLFETVVDMLDLMAIQGVVGCSDAHMMLTNLAELPGGVEPR